jgi:hypothetical protein
VKSGNGKHGAYAENNTDSMRIDGTDQERRGEGRLNRVRGRYYIKGAKVPGTGVTTRINTYEDCGRDRYYKKGAVVPGTGVATRVSVDGTDQYYIKSGRRSSLLGTGVAARVYFLRERSVL